MKRIAVLCAVVLLLLLCLEAPAAEATGPDRDRLDVNPLPQPPEEVKPEKDLLDVVGGYVWHRFRDLTDVFTLKLGWGNYRSIGAQARLVGPVQVGAAYFEGWTFAVDRGCVGVMKEVEGEIGVSIFYPTFIARKVRWQTEDAKRRNVFFGDVGDKNELAVEDIKLYDDANQHPLTSTAQVQLPCLPKIELTLNWGELPDFLLSLFAVDGMRVPAKFHKENGPDGEGGERIPAPSIFWHGQETPDDFK
jgi:hypothetical protein